MRAIAGVPALLLLAGGGAHAAELAPDVAAACLEALPEEWREGVEPGQMEGATEEGRWELHPGEMDGEGSPEAILLVLPEEDRGQAFFVGAREGKSPKREKIKLGGHITGYASVTYHPFTEGRSLAHVSGDLAGQALLYWDGKKLSRVWKVGKTREGDVHWFDMEDLDGDGVREVIAYHRRQLDVFYADEDDLDERGGSDPAGAGQVDATAVYRWVEGRWREDKRLLDELR